VVEVATGTARQALAAGAAVELDRIRLQEGE